MKRGIICLAILGAWIILLPSPLAKADGPTRDDCVGDVDGDGDTDLTDLGIFLPAWGSQPGDPNWDPRADLNGDGRVDCSDRGILLADWGCPDGNPGCDGEPSDALQFDGVPVDNSAVQPGDDPEAPDFAGGVTHFTFDLLVIVTDDNDWTAVLAEFALLDGGITFFEHLVGTNGPPNPVLFQIFPALEFDSFYTMPGSFPNTEGADAPDFLWPLISDPQLRSVGWYDTPNTGGGAFVLARYTIVVADGSATIPSVVAEGGGGGAPILGMLTGVATSYNTLGDCNEFVFDLIVGQCRGDLDGDYDIDQADLGLLLGDWGCTGGGCPGDCDNDGDTDQSDLGVLLAHWGMTCP